MSEQLTKTNYKQTEIGLIPEDWDLKSIDDVVKISTGSKNTQDKISDGKYPFYVRSQTIERINSYSYDCEAVLTVGDGVGTGKVFHYVNKKFELHQRVYIMNEFVNDLHGYYFYLFFSNNFYGRVMQMTAKSSVDSVRREMIADMKIPLPPLPEQKAIAQVLSDTDTLIQTITQKLTKKRAIKQGAMQQLLTPKDDWEVKRLGEVCDFLDNLRKPIKSSDRKNIEGNYPYYGASGIIDYVNDYIFDDELILLGEDGENILSRNLPLAFIAKGKFWVNNHAHVLKPKLGYNINFLVEQLESKDYKLLNSGTAQPKLNKQSCYKIKLFFPPLEEQTQIATILSDMDLEITQLEEKLAKYKVIKQGLMQNLLTGKIRLV